MFFFNDINRTWKQGLARRPLWVAVFLCLSLFLACSANLLALEVPAYRGYVNDYADMISPAEEARLERALQSFDLTDSTQIAILTIPSLEGDALEDFSIRTADKWKMGRKGRDNGVLLLVAKGERQVRIEVGRGLEGVLTDLLSGRIIDGIITPSFKDGRFDQGFDAGVAAIIQATRGEFKADRVTRARRRDEPSPLFKFLFFGLAAAAFLGSMSRPFGMLAGGLLFPLAFLFGLMPSFGILALLLFIPAGALFGGLLLPLLLAGFLRGGGLYMGGGFGGRGGGFGGGFGGFGGGGFGGGGASGGW